MVGDRLITQARLVEDGQLYTLQIHNGIITACSPQTPDPPTGPTLDLGGDWLSLGGMDLQINGGLGLAFPDLTPEDQPQLQAIARYLWEQGVDGFCPTIVTTAMDKIHQAMAVIADSGLLNPPAGHAQILGVHLEGPFLNPAKRGAHPEAHLQPLTLERVQRVLGDFAPVVKIVTLAPELEPGGEAIRDSAPIAYLVNQGITVSLGHSLATAPQAQAAFDQGATMITHAFNAMPPLHHRDPGLLGAALTRPGVYSGFIADGEHISPMMLQLLLRMNGGGLFLVSDALAPLGLPDGVYPWDERQITIAQGTARLDAQTLAGTTLPLLKGVENLVDWGLSGVGEAIALATEAPRRAIGQPGLTVGQRASFLRWSGGEGQPLQWQRLAV
ncbi:N-acetylglucosamine-6-phosphate deacetylase [Spirulina sp. CCNP1310]|uniref:N-acetylglucosamine-6-phosphate deacetylase n=1 Tax=Spirulina sp. CCNP1310 TaxID=3110249 RepID=UPI002B21B4CA|nr:N-acetylglucosamine-6-phosphate deacetylase [Spirulina sp. CCNP1310]MEA5421162.1 N-acetylglucosamine-6-phosphate deacetylase [Spirulina sp. CCNP1310]